MVVEGNHPFKKTGSGSGIYGERHWYSSGREATRHRRLPLITPRRRVSKKPTCHDDGGDGEEEESKDFHPRREKA